MHRLLTIDPATYQKHAIHSGNHIWAETNCYVDLWIELLHAYGCEPNAALPFTFAIDFEGDQWTFFKFPLVDLYDLHGMEVQELSIWRSLLVHVEEQIKNGRPVLVELDSFYLPDTAGTAYKLEHTKTTVGINEIDIQNRHLGYFHNQGYFHLGGDDFTKIFFLDREPGAVILPPYVEFVKVHSDKALKNRALVDASIAILKKHLAFVPSVNPFSKFKARLEQDMQWLMTEDIKMFHLYSFATLRQCGACFELCATYLDWLAANGEANVGETAKLFTEISNSAKTYQFQLARAMSRKKSLDFGPLDAMGQLWQRGIDQVRQQYA